MHCYNTRLQAKKVAEEQAKAKAEAQARAEAKARQSPNGLDQVINLQLARLKEYMNCERVVDKEQRIEVMIEMFRYLKTAKEVWIYRPQFRTVLVNKINHMLQDQIPHERINMCLKRLNIKRQQNLAELENVLVELGKIVTRE